MKLVVLNVFHQKPLHVIKFLLKFLFSSTFTLLEAYLLNVEPFIHLVIQRLLRSRFFLNDTLAIMFKLKTKKNCYGSPCHWKLC